MLRLIRQLLCRHEWREGWPEGEPLPSDAFMTCYCAKCPKRGVVRLSDLRAS